MKDLFKLLVFILSITACASASKPINEHREVAEIVREFEYFCNCRVDIPIYFTSFDSSVIGMCYGFLGPYFLKSIDLDKEYWDNASFYQKEELLFHELGHCILNRMHDDRMIPSGFPHPYSIMYPYTFYQYQYHRDYYIEELFKSK